MIKLLENTFRAVNIALVNEIALMCEKLDLDVWEVIDGAATKPFGFMPFYPGAGIGGHCIPLDPHYLSWKLKTLNYSARFIELAAEINGSMPPGRRAPAADLLNERLKKSVNGSTDPGARRGLQAGHERRAGISGAGHHASAAGAGRALSFHDPLVNSGARGSTEAVVAHRATRPLTQPKNLAAADLVVIVTDHSSYDYDDGRASREAGVGHPERDPGRRSDGAVQGAPSCSPLGLTWAAGERGSMGDDDASVS